MKLFSLVSANEARRDGGTAFILSADELRGKKRNSSASDLGKKCDSCKRLTDNDLRNRGKFRTSLTGPSSAWSLDNPCPRIDNRWRGLVWDESDCGIR